MLGRGSIGRPFARPVAIAVGIWLIAAANLISTPAPGIFATVADSVTSTGNSVSTGDFVQPPNEELAVSAQRAELQAAQPVVVDEQPTCESPDVAWANASVAAMFDSSVGIAPSPPRRVYDGGLFCLRSADPASPQMNVSLVVTNFVQTDPECSPGEAEVDTTCGTTAPGSGEISEELFWNASVSFRADVHCRRVNETSDASLHNGARMFVTQLSGSDGAVCIGVQFSTDIPEGSHRLARVMTDRAVWSWIAEAEHA